MSVDSLEDAIRACEVLAARLPLELAMTGHASTIAERVTPAPAARFAIETALLTAIAQARGTSVASLFNALPQAEIESAMVVDTETEARDAVSRGVRCLKIKMAANELARVQRIAKAAPTARLRIDANRGWPVEETPALLAALADLPIEYVEEPCLDAADLLDRDLPVKLALDESLGELDPDALERALSSPLLAAIILKPTLLGGFHRCIDLAQAAHAHGVAPIVSHALEGPIGTAACHELARAIGADIPVGLGHHPALESFERRVIRDAGDVRLGIESAAAVANPRIVTTSTQRVVAAGSIPPWSPRILVATPNVETIREVYAALAAHEPIALLHSAGTAAEHERQRELVAHAKLGGDDAVVLFTSGSTGPAKGVVLSRKALVASAEASAQLFGWRDGDRWLCCLPLAHSGGLSVAIRCLLGKKTIVLRDDDTPISHALEARDVTLASLVPAQLAALLDDPAWRPPAKLRAVLLGGAAAPDALVAAALDRGVPVRLTYGLTETFGQVATARAPGELPKPLAGVTITGGTADAPALLRVRGPMLATRYLDGTPIAPELVTADLGYVDADGVHVIGRADDVIITGGENVHPSQVEAVVACTPGVRAGVAFGVADPRWGHVVAVALTTDARFDAVQALASWHRALPPHARPRRLAVVDSLPLLPSGKLDRRSIATLPTSPIDYA
ncbi:MAG: AMP-binding protein [Kofleriaceae bacterium]|nr:AMP-binding protein [Kofleriaceae bacterium]